MNNGSQELAGYISSLHPGHYCSKSGVQIDATQLALILKVLVTMQVSMRGLKNTPGQISLPNVFWG